ncbi:MAG TPA: metallophosphoesterase [bacterium]|nr:metallophosphoesterase [bacterium]
MSLRGSVPLLGILVLVGAAIVGPTAAQPLPLAAWTQIGPGGSVIARAVTSGACPSGLVAGRSRPMEIRAPAAPNFPVTACELVLGPKPAAFSVAGAPVPRAAVRKIVVVGDTGCRIKQLKKRVEFQACNDPAQWPWATIAASAAAWGPDLVIHVGDLLYREVACPAGQSGCANSPWGYNWTTNNVDFFIPAKPLLAAAPWIFVRGDHEACGRNGAAWFMFFDPRPRSGACLAFTGPYNVPLGNQDVVVLDSSGAGDDQVNAGQVGTYAQQFKASGQLIARTGWLLSHKPVWGIFKRNKKGQVFSDNPTLAAAAAQALPASVQMVLSGHIHFLQVLTYVGRPPQVVVGNSGTLRIPAVKGPLAGTSVAGTPVASGRVLEEFGFLTLQAISGGWQVTARDRRGAPLMQCTLIGRVLACPPQ